jgi:hypothetical protein
MRKRGFNMTDLLKLERNILMIFSIFLTTSGAFAASNKKNDAKTLDEVSKYADQCSKKRDDHIQAMRELHVKHINELYDRKAAHNKEMTAMWKQMKPGDNEGNKALRDQMKEKHEAFEKEEEKFREDFKENVLKKKNKEFRESMENREKEMKEKFKD